MSQWRQGTVRVTNGSQVVVGDNTDWITADFQGGEVFSLDGSGIGYEVAGPATSLGSPSQFELTLTAAYQGVTATGQDYAVSTSLTPNHDLPYPEFGDIDTPTLVKRALLQIDALFGADMGEASHAGRVVFTDASGNATTEAALAYNASTDTLTAVNLSLTTITCSGTATFNGNTVIGNASGDTLTIAPNAVTWSNDPTHSGNHTFSGNLTVNGNTTIGNAAGDTLTINAATVSKPNIPCFLAHNSADDTNQTGNGATATVDFDTEIFDQAANFASDTFTAPATGRYLLCAGVEMDLLSTAMSLSRILIVTSNRTYRNQININVESANDNHSLVLTALVDMDAADTAVVQVIVGGGAGDSVTLVGGAILSTFFSGVRLA